MLSQPRSPLRAVTSRPLQQAASQPASRPKQSRTLSLSKHKVANAQAAAAAVEKENRAPSDEPAQQPKRQRTGPLPTSLHLGESIWAVAYAGFAAGTISISSENLQLLEDKLQYWSESKPAAAGELFSALQEYHNSIPVEHRGMQVCSARHCDCAGVKPVKAFP